MRGINDPIKQREAASFVRKNKLSLFGLIEHKIKEVNCNKIINTMFPSWSFVHNSIIAPGGRICVVWDPSILNLSVVSQTSQSMHCNVPFIAGNFNFTATYVYGSNLYMDRKDLWSDPIRVYSDLVSVCWIL